MGQLGRIPRQPTLPPLAQPSPTASNPSRPRTHCISPPGGSHNSASHLTNARAAACRSRVPLSVGPPSLGRLPRANSAPWAKLTKPLTLIGQPHGHGTGWPNLSPATRAHGCTSSRCASAVWAPSVRSIRSPSLSLLRFGH
jgi:hypothetical protein